MNQYLIVLKVEGKRTEVTISATSESNARKIAMVQFGRGDVKVIRSEKLR